MGSRTVLFFGQSLLIGVVAAALGQCPDLRVMQAATWTEASRLLAEQLPDVLIFDQNAANDGQLLPLLLRNPHLLMIGLDAERNQGVVVSGQEARSLTLGQIREIAVTGARHQAGDARLAKASGT